MTSKEFWDLVKKWVTRRNMELLAALLILLCAASVFWTHHASQASVQLDEGAITYKGTMVANKMSGKGTLTFKNGDRYVGQFKNGQFNGHGTFTAKAGWTYEGQFENGVASGQGKLTTEKNIVYQGQFKEGIYQHAD